ncbi:hypothetical protein DY000_02060135 [Brassica cretica]|uniref:Uncharacterized protein n=1 Tax=Brassica cretica TaxID=69181 RepID=A0ABQ7APJ1_BRACR|nr:hypothetical protein DY000_02060135 [Brassica cretica]
MDGDLPTVRLSPSFDTRYSFDLAFQCHRFEVNQYPVADVMPILLKSGQCASQEELVEEMKDCRSITQQWSQSTVMPERGPSIFQDQASIDVLAIASIDARSWFARESWNT